MSKQPTRGFKLASVLVLTAALMFSRVYGSPPQPSASPSSSPAPTVSASPSSPYVGNDKCEECHDDFDDTWHRTLHSKIPSNQPDGPDKCEGCHGPGAKHADSSDAQDIINPARLKGRDASAICERCHDGMRGQYEWRFSEHATVNISCEECHWMHPPDKKDIGAHLLRKGGQPGLCFTCHADVQAQTMWPSHHPISEGEMMCTDCHNPHGAQLSAFKNAPTSRELCLNCHAQFRGPFAVEHEPAQEDCMICHSPHGSMNNDLLVASEPFLCQRCHAEVHNPHLPAPLLSNATLAGEALQFSNCTACHVGVHGSDQSTTFTR